MGEDVILSVIILRHDDLLSSEEGSKVFVEVHLFFEAHWVVTDPEILRISFKTYVEHTERKNEKDSDGAYDHDGAVVVVEPS